MKKLSLVLGLIMIASLASAKTKTESNTSKFDVRVPVRNWLKKMNDGFRVGVATGSLSTNVRARSAQNGGFDVSNNETANSNFQLHVGYEQIKNQELGYSSFFTYQNATADFEGDSEDYRSMRVSANATWGFDKQVYAYGGLNYGDIYGSDDVESLFDPGIGYQLGLGFKIIDQAQLEIEYLTLQNEGSRSKVNYDFTAQGIMLKINTPFTLNI